MFTASTLTRTTNPARNVHIASESVYKSDGARLAVTAVLKPSAINLVTHKTASGVPNQPKGYQQTAKGAENRMDALLREINVEAHDVLVAVEHGLRFAEDENKYYDFVHVIVEMNGERAVYTEDCCEVPHEIVRVLDDKGEVTWGDVAKQKGQVRFAHNPHQEASFGGLSREVHIQKALSAALEKLHPQQQDTLMVKRTAELHDHRSPKRYEGRGIEFLVVEEEKARETIHLQHGYPLPDWRENAGTDKEVPASMTANAFQVFETGDAFSVISPDIELDGANVNIHVDVKHDKYSPLVLLHEALQLCRASYEQNANKVTVALPQQYHPLLHPSDFNVLLANLFNASGAASLEFYDPAHPEQREPLSCPKAPLVNYKEWNSEGTWDEKARHYMRKHALSRAFMQYDVNAVEAESILRADKAPAKIYPTVNNPPHTVLCCSANRPFALKIAASLKARGEQVNLVNIEGQGAEAMIPSSAVLCGGTVTIVQSTRPNPDDVKLSADYEKNGASAYFFEAMMVARQAHMRGALQVNLVNPYQFGARSDKAEDNSKGKTGAYVQLNGELLEAAGVNHVITAECHDPHTLSGAYTGEKIKGSAVAAITEITANIAREWSRSPHTGQFRLVTPDAGAAKRTKELTQTLQAILAGKLSKQRILGEKDRATHKDDSALVSNLNVGDVGINANDKYVVTDDEVATGTTLSKTLFILIQQGAKDISVVEAHNNMDTDWLKRQLSLARFLSMGVKDIHFGDTQELGTLPTSYEHLIQTYATMASKSPADVEARVSKWFTEKMADYGVSANAFKAVFSEFKDRVIVHSLTESFVDKLTHKRKPALTLVEGQGKSVYVANTLFSPPGTKTVDVAVNEPSGLNRAM